MEALDDEGQSRFVGYRAMAYKVANLIARGPLLILVGIVGWSLGLFVAAALLFAVAAFHWFMLPKVERREHGIRELLAGLLHLRVLAVAAVLALVIVGERELQILAPVWDGIRGAVSSVPALAKISAPGWIVLALLAGLLVALAMLPRIRRRVRDSDSYYGQAFVAFLDQPQVGRILAFVILFRTGESFLQKMRWPFLNGELGMSVEQYGLANGTIGVFAGFVATFVGGWLISKHGLRRWIWPFVLAQNVLNLLYMVLALVPTEGGVGMPVLTVLIAIEEFGAGLGTAVFMVYLMRCCDPAHKAAHFAILSALMSVSFTIAGVASGFLADAIGFASYFGFTFLATVPMMALIFVIPRLDREPVR
jgi:PAT family beta-lactamase induction signal transducer AmpG